MVCRDVDKGDLAEKYLNGQLDPATQDDFELHILECLDCQHFLEALQAARDDLASHADEIRSHSSFTRGRLQWAWVGAAAILIAGLAVVVYFGYTTEARLSDDLAKQRDRDKILSAQLDQANSRIAALKGLVEITTQRMGLTQSELAEAKSRAEDIRKEQQAADQELTTQIKASQEQIGAVATKVVGAKKDLEATKTDLEATKGKLERSMGDMNVMSGLIAHNRDDLEELRRRGDRNYYEFTVQKSKHGRRVGPVQVTLIRTDPKKSKYTINVIADDKTIEKRDKTSGEPVQFYVKGSPRLAPYEIVVFEVGTNQITGYLATPKDSGTPAPAAAVAPTAPSTDKP